MAKLSSTLAFALGLTVALVALRLLLPQPYEKVGLHRVAFIALDIQGYARSAVVPMVLFAIGTLFARDLSLWPALLIGVAFALAQTTLFYAARWCCATAPDGTYRDLVTLLFVVLAIALTLGCVALPRLTDAIG